jgi:hypothetical protein
MHFGQPASIGQLEALLVSFDELWSALKHFGQPGSTLVILKARWSAWKHIQNIAYSIQQSWSFELFFFHSNMCTLKNIDQ